MKRLGAVARESGLRVGILGAKARRLFEALALLRAPLHPPHRAPRVFEVDAGLGDVLLCLQLHKAFLALKGSMHIQGTFSVHSGNVQCTFRERSVHIQGTFSAHSVNIQ